ncbi:MAG: type IV pilin [Halobacteriota archaeon]
MRTDRGTVPVVGVALTLVVTVVLAATVGGVALETATNEEPVTHTALSLSVTGDRIVLVHRGGGTLDVRTLRLRVRVDGVPLDHQPPVPFFSATGFRSGPTGPFNPAADPHWSAGETATVHLAETNAPGVAPGDGVLVTVYTGDTRVASLSATATEG